MAARHSPYTNLNYETDIRREGREWNSIPKLEDLRKGHELVQSFSEGRLHLSSPLVFTQAGRRSFDGHFLGAALLGELLASDVVSEDRGRRGPSMALTSHRYTGWSSRRSHSALVSIRNTSLRADNLKRPRNWRRRKRCTSRFSTSCRMRSVCPRGETPANMPRG